MSCNLDLVNMCCWTHGVDITEADYIEGVCAIGYIEEEEAYDEDPDDYYPDEETMRRFREKELMRRELADALEKTAEKSDDQWSAQDA